MIKIQLALQSILEMARSHVEDIESGLEEGLYELKDNEDLSTKKAAIEEVDAYLRERSASPDPLLHRWRSHGNGDICLSGTDACPRVFRGSLPALDRWRVGLSRKRPEIPWTGNRMGGPTTAQNAGEGWWYIMSPEQLRYEAYHSKEQREARLAKARQESEASIAEAHRLFFEGDREAAQAVLFDAGFQDEGIVHLLGTWGSEYS